MPCYPQNDPQPAALDIEFDAKAHRYYLAGRELPSVTQVIGGLKLSPPYPKTESSMAAMNPTSFGKPKSMTEAANTPGGLCAIHTRSYFDLACCFIKRVS